MGAFMDSIHQLVANPIFWVIIIGYYIFSSAVGALEMPGPTSGPFYRFAFKFLNGLAANLHRVAASVHVPGIDEQK